MLGSFLGACSIVIIAMAIWIGHRKKTGQPLNVQDLAEKPQKAPALHSVEEGNQYCEISQTGGEFQSGYSA